MVSDDTRGNDLSGSLQGAGGIGGLLARSDNTKLLLTQDSTLASACYHSDGNGNVTCLIYTNQFIAAKYLYDPFGNILSMYGPLAEANLYRFSSKEYHPNSGLVYYLYRFYDPNLQRWINRDPLRESGFELLRKSGGGRGSEGLNLYAYIGNNGIGKIDAHGLKIWLCTVAADPPFPTWARHAYLWDDRPGIDAKSRECGMESSSGSGSNGNSSGNTGPSDGETANPWHGKGQKGETECYQVDDSSGKEQAVMDCCRAKANQGVFVPYAHDCHDAADRCLKENGLASPPHSRGDPISNHAKDIECACRDE
jgi:RHS repeat-associated protein